MSTPPITIVVPCYNESQRLAVSTFQQFVVQHPSVRFLFVNDGSHDATLSILQQLNAANPAQFDVLDLPQNQGKAEAVRRGMLRAFDANASYVGYWDADLATPLAEIPRFVDALDQHAERQICFGSRVRLLGRSIDRNAVRHYLGRLFATVASYVLDLAVYDTQCGAKLFRASARTRDLFAVPFCVNWTFDVELIARLQSQTATGTLAGDAHERIYELPLNDWHDVAGSKVRAGDFVTALFEMWRVYRKYGRGGRHAPTR
ncbi:MAG TPA: glycosyltransferase [Polyangiales bacterium]|nr:glycosyltransferase [Polyangiales bacterium]